jgi:16S rRNA (guanine527-N7)-methyltransferase
MSVKEKFKAGVIAAGLNLSEAVEQKLLDYLALIVKWNKVHNLTAVRDPDEMVTLHLLDSLAVLPFIKAETLLDVGSGAGLPGIPLAICLPNLKVTVIDSSQKKASFMRQVKAELGIENLEVLCGRVEAISAEKQFDVVISRAFSDLCLFVSLTKHLCKASGTWLAMKGVFPEAELSALAKKHHLSPAKTEVLKVPGLDAQRHLVFLPYENFNMIKSD